MTRVKAKHCVLASWNMMIPYLCPELPAPQKTALHQLIKTPLVYTSVALRNWESFQKLGIRSVTAPGGYHSAFHLNQPVNIGGYQSPRDPAAADADPHAAHAGQARAAGARAAQGRPRGIARHVL